MPITIGKSIEIDNRQYDVKKILGKGGLSIVYLAIEQGTNQKVAIKEFFFQKFYDPITHENDCAEFFENEVLNTQAQARSGLNCMQVLSFEKKEDLQTPEYYIIFSFIEGIEFLQFYREFIQTCRGLQNLDLASIVRYIFIPIAELLDYCHTKEFIVHRDLSVRNIIIQKHIDEKTGDSAFSPILLDFGISKWVSESWIFYTPKPYMTDDMSRDIPVTQKGAPPEIKFGFMPNATSDIYYLAHLMYFVFTGGIMREDSEIKNKEDYVLSPGDINWYIPHEYNEVVKKMSQYEPADRPQNMKEVIKMLRDLIQIKQVHFDFELLFNSPDTDELTGKKIAD